MMFIKALQEAFYTLAHAEPLSFASPLSFVNP